MLNLPLDPRLNRLLTLPIKSHLASLSKKSKYTARLDYCPTSPATPPKLCSSPHSLSAAAAAAALGQGGRPCF